MNIENSNYLSNNIIQNSTNTIVTNHFIGEINNPQIQNNFNNNNNNVENYNNNSNINNDNNLMLYNNENINYYSNNNYYNNQFQNKGYEINDNNDNKFNENLNIDELKKNQLPNNDDEMIKTCLENFGETFYLNAILQNLLNIDDFKNFFLGDNIIKYIKQNQKEKSLSYVTYRLFHHVYIKRDKKYSVHSFIKALADINLYYASKKTRNVNECLIFILKRLHTELNELKDKDENKNYNKLDREDVINYEIVNFKNTNDSIISNIFTWFSIEECKCTNCKYISFEFKNFYTFQLNILEFLQKLNRNNFTIYDYLNFENKKKQKKYCNNCKSEEEIEIFSSIYSSPKISIFLFDQGNFDEKLININFYLEEKINLNKFLENEKSPKIYELIGIISINKEDKKYHSFCKSFENQKWYFFKEENVEQIKSDRVIFEHNSGQFIPNILFYKSIEE